MVERVAWREEVGGMTGAAGAGTTPGGELHSVVSSRREALIDVNANASSTPGAQHGCPDSTGCY
ncbi:hypothetical protein ACFJIX_24470 [Roseateles sp. UC29_93]|uniref:hypothetical protein n=1 Tax=Roseateles sp. UC29_93 TaxID=3350177 RepID=UPI0002E016B0